MQYVITSIALVTLLFAHSLFAQPSENTSSVQMFVESQSWSNIIPAKDLLEDEWRNIPNNAASEGFTQNEIGLAAVFNSVSFTISHRYDYFVYSNADTAEAFYLLRQKLPLNTKENYSLDLKLFHQRSNGVRLGYKAKFDTFSIEPKLGYWQLDASRESYLSGTLTNDTTDNVAGFAQLKEFYSDRNFLKRKNYNKDWDTDGTGITLDIHMTWQVTDKIGLDANLRDIYSDFSIDNAGYSEGAANTNGKYINSVGGIAYLPIYRGKETEKEHQFELPKYIDVTGIYTSENINYLARIKRQGDHNFYYLGMEFLSPKQSWRFSFDIENKAPEIQYTNKWLSLLFAIDDIQIEKALQLSLGMAVQYNF